tara:strand:+ start:112 stop:972 length:861 start_codon:yes stop_codon:yes gene_type:complete
MIIWLASYPKSGNTWLRFFIISLLMGKRSKLNLNHLKAIMAYPHVSQFKDLVSNFLDLEEVAKNWIISQEKVNKNKNLRFLKTHNMLGKYKGYSFTDAKNTLGTIHIVRDPRNIITSLKNHFSLSNYNEAKDFLFDDSKVITLSEQQKEKYFNKLEHPLPQFIGSWKTHYLSWKNMQKNYILVKYEDLRDNPFFEFNKISNFISNLTGIKFTDEQIKLAINLSSFEKLDALEKKYGFIESTTNKQGKKNKFFFLGPKNDWKKILDNQTSNDIGRKFENEMKELKYL